jgi:hypothetical protein
VVDIGVIRGLDTGGIRPSEQPPCGQPAFRQGSAWAQGGEKSGSKPGPVAFCYASEGEQRAYMGGMAADVGVDGWDGYKRG